MTTTFAATQLAVASIKLGLAVRNSVGGAEHAMTLECIEANAHASADTIIHNRSSPPAARTHGSLIVISNCRALEIRIAEVQSNAWLEELASRWETTSPPVN